MKTKSFRKPLLVVGAVIVLLAAFGLVNKPDMSASANNVFSLQPPPFVGIARAETGSAASIIENEAGISAWFQASTSISLASVRGVFRTIEVETANYIIGSVPVVDYPETEDIHVYVHKDGWILAYYLKADPVGKIFDWRTYHNSGRTNISTKLENALGTVASAAGVPGPSVTFYDFRYPNATHLMLIVEWISDDGTDSFQVKLPGSFAYYERSWSLGEMGGGGNDCSNEYRLNGARIGGVWPWGTTQGILTAAQLPPDQFHSIEVSTWWRCPSSSYVYGGLALVYRVP